MDSRLKFLHRGTTELWGRRREARPGTENPGQAQEERERKNPPAIRRRDADRTMSREECGPAAKKSRYCLYRARTANRHRWAG